MGLYLPDVVDLSDQDVNSCGDVTHCVFANIATMNVRWKSNEMARTSTVADF
jgi:hypothetical protein